MSSLIGLLTLNPAAARYFADAAREPTPPAAGSRAPDPDTNRPRYVVTSTLTVQAVGI